MNWEVHQAKGRFSELLDRTMKEGPQTVTRHGKAVAVMVSMEEYRRLRPRRKSLKKLCWHPPRWKASKSCARAIPAALSRCDVSGQKDGIFVVGRGLTLVTRNIKDIARSGVRCL